ncbi:MAG TPA: PilN domain-containing protein [Patescibacteria group bacterium]|nr:PilN domain-containing protein [Patescibacteria group bacterium]
MKVINLLPKSQKKELELEFISHQILVFWIMVIITLVMFVAVAWVFKFYIAQVIASNDQLVAESQAKVGSAEYKSLHDQIIGLNGSAADIKNLARHHYDWSGALYQLSGLVPAEVQLNDLQFDAATGKVDIDGQARTRQDVLDLWANITNSQYFSKINFPLSNLEKPVNSNFSFSFYANKDKFIDQQ